MSDMVSPLLQWLNANPELAGLATFIISAAESVAIIGTIVPGSITMTAIGTLAGAGVIPLTATIMYAILGAIVGDSISYWLGHYFKDRLRRTWPFRTNPNVLAKGEHFVNKYGVMSVFIGRFVGPVRALVPLVAGMLGMKPVQFTIANILSAIGWAPAYMLPGILLGAASLELPPDIALHVILVLFLITLFIALCMWVILKIYQLLSKQIHQFKLWLWHQLSTSRSGRAFIGLLKHHDNAKLPGQLSLALLATISFLTFLILTIYVKWRGAENITLNEMIYHLFRGNRHSSIQLLMIHLTFLGQKQIIIPSMLLIAALCALKKYWRLATHLLLLVLAAAVNVYLFKHLIQSPRPWGILQNPESFSMPSGHTTLAMTCFFGLAYFSSRHFARLGKKILYAIAALLVMSVAISRLYLGAHWCTDIISSILLGSAILSVIIISFERYLSSYPRPLFLLPTIIISFAGFYSYYNYATLNKTLLYYQQLTTPEKQLSLTEWWQGQQHDMAATRTNIFGFPAERINFEWAGSLTQIQHSLQEASWQNPPARDWISILHRIADVSSTQYLPLIAPQYLDKKPALTLTKALPHKKGLMVVRLWAAYRVLEPGNIPVWAGVIAIIPRTYSGLFRRTYIPVETIPTMLFAKSKLWQWNIVTLVDKRKVAHPVLLIKTYHLDK